MRSCQASTHSPFAVSHGTPWWMRGRRPLGSEPSTSTHFNTWYCCIQNETKLRTLAHGLLKVTKIWICIWLVTTIVEMSPTSFLSYIRSEESWKATQSITQLGKKIKFLVLKSPGKCIDDHHFKTAFFSDSLWFKMRRKWTLFYHSGF